MTSFNNFSTKTIGLATLLGSLALAACTGASPTGAGGAGGGGPSTGSCPSTTHPTSAYTSGWQTDPLFGGYNITYPTDMSSFGGIIIITGFLANVSGMASWGPFFASKGVATFLINPPNPANNPADRSLAQIAALASFKAEATRAGSPLQGKLDINRLAVAGWSMGGGGTLHTANTNPPGVKAALAFAPWEVGGMYPEDRVPTIILAGGDADTLVNAAMSRGEYDSLSASTSRAYCEWSGCTHSQWQTPNACGGQGGQFAWAWVNAYLNGVSECKAVIGSTSTMTDFASGAL